jgi:membrane-associated phospholipid phosphatase
MMEQNHAAPEESAPASPSETGGGFCPLRCLTGVFTQSRTVWKAHRLWLLVMTGCVFLLALGLRPFDAGWMELSVIGEHPELDSLARGLSRWGEFHLAPFIVFGALALVGWILKRRAMLYAVCASFLGGATAGIIVMVAKVVFGRPRPYVDAVDGFYWFKFGHDWASFPSGHSAHCFGMAVGLSIVLPWTWPFTLLAAAAVAWSRYQLDRHYPTDILMGLWVGVAAGLVFGLAARRCRRPAELAAGSGSAAPAPSSK